MAYLDALDTDLAGLDLQLRADGHDGRYARALANMKSIVNHARNLIDDRATGEFPRLERTRRETPTDPETAKPMGEMPRTPIVEHRRRRTKDDDER